MHVILVAVAFVYAILIYKARITEYRILGTSHDREVKVIYDTPESSTLNTITIVKVDSIEWEICYKDIVKMKVIVAKAGELLLNLTESSQYLSNDYFQCGVRQLLLSMKLLEHLVEISSREELHLHYILLRDIGSELVALEYTWFEVSAP
jgi:hypothetical protein